MAWGGSAGPGAMPLVSEKLKAGIEAQVAAETGVRHALDD